MPWRKISEKQFDTLYQYNIPRLYRAALVMMGDQAVAERAAADAFLQTMLDPACAEDNRAFSDHSLGMLCRFCRWETTPYDPSAVAAVGFSEQLADLLSRSTPNERILLALSAVLEMGNTQIAAITGWPRCLVSWRLQYLARGMAAEQKYFMEEEALYLSQPVHPF